MRPNQELEYFPMQKIWVANFNVFFLAHIRNKNKAFLQIKISRLELLDKIKLSLGNHYATSSCNLHQYNALEIIMFSYLPDHILVQNSRSVCSMCLHGLPGIKKTLLFLKHCIGVSYSTSSIMIPSDSLILSRSSR